MADIWQTRQTHGTHMADTCQTRLTHGTHGRYIADTADTWQTRRHMAVMANIWQTLGRHLADTL